MTTRERSNTGDRISGIDYTANPGPAAGMAAFDALPAVVRRAVAEAPYNFDTIAILDQVKIARDPRRLAIEIELAAKAYVDAAYAEMGKAR